MNELVKDRRIDLLGAMYRQIGSETRGRQNVGAATKGRSLPHDRPVGRLTNPGSPGPIAIRRRLYCWDDSSMVRLYFGTGATRPFGSVSRSQPIFSGFDWLRIA